MKYCPKCNLAGDCLAYEWCGQVGCLNCGGPLTEKNYEWIKSKKVTVVSEIQGEGLESPPYP